MQAKKVLLQLLKFGVSGIVSVAVSTALYYYFRGSLPDLVCAYWLCKLDLVDMGFYELTAITGGIIHFALSKIWVFDK